MDDKKLPLLGDARDESAETVRLVLEPKSRAVDPVLLMESLFRLTELEVRISLNMNVLSAGQVPGVLSLRDVLKHWLEHRQVVLVRRSEFRLKKIEHRLEVLDGYLIAYLNLDEVIRIVRFEDEPKAKLIKRFKLTEVQAEAILNLRLKSLSRLEEIEIKAEHDKLSKERRELKSLLKSDEQQWERITEEVKATREAYSKKTELGRRRTSFADAPAIEVDLDQAMIEKEPITVILSEKGWIRAMKGHVDDLSKLEFKQGDALRRAVKAQTTDKLLLLASNGKVFTLPGDQLPGGRGHGEPVRLMVDLEENHAFVEIFVHEPGRKLLVAATLGPRLRRAGGRGGRHDPQGQAGAERRRAGGGLRVRAGRGRHGRGHRREPQDADLPDRGGQRDVARQGRASCSASRTAACRTCASSRRATA